MSNQTTTPMFGSANTTSSSLPTFYTGLTTFNPLGVNPSKDQIEEWTGKKYNLNVDYTIREFNGVTRRPVEIWLKSDDGNIIEPLRYSITVTPVMSQKGNQQFVNSVGNFTYGENAEALIANEKMKWFTMHPFRQAMVGEQDVSNFMIELMRFNSRDESADFLADCEKNNITPAKLYDGDFAGLRTFIDWCKGNSNKIVALAAVRKTDKLTAEGQSKTYFNQLIVGKPEYIFRNSTGEVTARNVARLVEDIDKGVVVTNALFTVEYREFNEKECYNSVPTTTAAAAPMTNIPVGGLSAFLNN